MSVNHNGNRLMKVLQARLKATQPTSDAVRTAFTRIGLQISAMAKVFARKQRIIDRGGLINSLGYEFYTQGSTAGVRVGSFGIKYAAMNEYGGTISPRQMRAMFASMRKRGGPVRPSKGVVTGDAIRGGTWKARPYLRPAVKASRQYTIDTLRELLRVGGGE